MQTLCETMESVTNFFSENMSGDFIHISSFKKILEKFDLPKDGISEVFFAHLIYQGWLIFGTFSTLLPKLHE